MSTPPAAATAHKKPSMEYDDARLDELAPPLQVNIEKVVAGRSTPVEVPVKPGESEMGAGWTSADVRELRSFIPRKWSGSGNYIVTVTDANKKKLRWSWYFSPSEYPTLPSPDASQAIEGAGGVISPAAAQAQAAAAAQAAVPMSIPTGPTASPMMIAPPHDPYMGWLGSSAPNPHTQRASGVPGAYMQTPQSARPVAQYGGPTMFGQPLPQVTPIASPSVTSEVQKEREERLKLEAQIERGRLEQTYNERFGTINSEVRSLAGSLQHLMSAVEKLATRPATEETPAERAMKERLAQLEKERSDDKIAQLIASQNAQMTQLITQMQANVDKQIAAIAAKPSGPDPQMTMMLEFFKMNATQQQQAMTLQLEAIKSQAASQPNTFQIIELMKSSQSGVEQQAQAFSKAWELMMTGVETILQNQGPGVHPALEMLGQGVQAAAQIGQQYVQMRENVGQQQAQATAMQAQSQAQLAQAIAVQRQPAALAGPQVAPPVQPTPPAAAPAEATSSNEDKPDDDDDDDDDDADDDDEASSAVVAPAVVSPEVTADRKKRDQQNFGVALSSVERLRKGVRDGKLDAAKAAFAIVQGVDQVAKAKAVVPAFGLWIEGRIAELVDLMLPDAKPSFREEVVGAILHMAQQARAAANQPQQG